MWNCWYNYKFRFVLMALCWYKIRLFLWCVDNFTCTNINTMFYFWYSFEKRSYFLNVLIWTVSKVCKAVFHIRRDLVVESNCGDVHGDSHKRDQDGRTILHGVEETLLHNANKLPGTYHSLPVHVGRKEEVSTIPVKLLKC